MVGCFKYVSGVIKGESLADVRKNLVYDDTDFLRNLMEETREYVNSNNIHRGISSWSFLVKDRMASKL